jgi:hypothetical protein
MEVDAVEISSEREIHRRERRVRRERILKKSERMIHHGAHRDRISIIKNYRREYI